MKYIALIGLVSAAKLLTSSPDESRAIFEQHRDQAEKVVSSQDKFEADHGAAHKKAMETADAEVQASKKRNNEQRVEGNNHLYRLGQAEPEEEAPATKKTSQEAAKAALDSQKKIASEHGAAHSKSMEAADADAQAAIKATREAKDKGLKNDWNPSTLADPSQYSDSTKAARENAKAVVSSQAKFAGDHAAAHAKSMSTADADAQANINKVREDKETGLKTQWN